MLANDANGTLNTWQIAILDQLIQNTPAAGSDEADLSLRIRPLVASRLDKGLQAVGSALLGEAAARRAGALIGSVLEEPLGWQSALTRPTLQQPRSLAHRSRRRVCYFPGFGESPSCTCIILRRFARSDRRFDLLQDAGRGQTHKVYNHDRLCTCHPCVLSDSV